MNYKKINKIIYNYACRNCGNEFEKDHECNPYICNVCHGTGTIEMEIIKIEVIDQFCPICNSYFETSGYLNQEIEDEHAKWLANMVTHYRHFHITSWDKTWGRNGHHYRKVWCNNLDYDGMKVIVNERAKRQILRKCKKVMIDNGFTVEHVLQLSHTDNKTIELYKKLLDTEQRLKLAS